MFRFIKVGSYDGSAPLQQQLQMEQSTIVWTTGQSQVGGHFYNYLSAYIA